MKALVLSGGGLFGAWQAGAWAELAPHFQPDLIVGASIGSLNGYLIAAGATPQELIAIWSTAEFRALKSFEGNLKRLTEQYPLRRPFALTVTDILRMKPRIYRDREITWRHLAASCAVPPVMPQVYLDGRWCTDGGLLNPLPAWAAVELGATDILGLNVLDRFPSRAIQPFVAGFRAVLGHHPPAPPGVRAAILSPRERLGGLYDSLWAGQPQIGRWIAQGTADARAWLAQKPFPL